MFDIPICLRFTGYIPWAILAPSVLDMNLDTSLRLLLKNNFPDILMAALLPLLLIFKIVKISYKIYKVMKAIKSWAKFAHLIKKIKVYKNNKKD